MEEKTVVGLVESITILASNKTVKARIDSGATIGSMDKTLIASLDIPISGKRVVRSSHGTTTREMIEVDINLKGKIVKGNFSIFDRSHMTYPVLIGQDVLKQGFLIDPQK